MSCRHRLLVIASCVYRLQRTVYTWSSTGSDRRISGDYGGGVADREVFSAGTRRSADLRDCHLHMVDPLHHMVDPLHQNSLAQMGCHHSVANILNSYFVGQVSI